jgi:hypothetical protein
MSSCQQDQLAAVSFEKGGLYAKLLKIPAGLNFLPFHFHDIGSSYNNRKVDLVLVKRIGSDLEL